MTKWNVNQMKDELRAFIFLFSSPFAPNQSQGRKKIHIDKRERERAERERGQGEEGILILIFFLKVSNRLNKLLC